MDRLLYLLAWVMTVATAAIGGYTLARPHPPRCVSPADLGVDSPAMRLYVYSLGGCFTERITKNPELLGLRKWESAYRPPWEDDD